MSSDNPEKVEQTLFEELEALYQDIQSKLEGASFLGKSMAKKFAPIEKIMVFIGKVVKRIERLDSENLFLKEELAKVNAELAKQQTVMAKLDNSCEVQEDLGIDL